MESKRFSDFFNRLKMNLLKSIVILVILAGGFSLCAKEEDEEFQVAYDASLMIGKWKIEKETGEFGYITDHSKYHE